LSQDRGDKPYCEPPRARCGGIVKRKERPIQAITEMTNLEFNSLPTFSGTGSGKKQGKVPKPCFLIISPGPIFHSDPEVQTPSFLPHTQESRPQPSSLRPRGPGPSLPPSDPGAQTSALLLRTQGSGPRPSSLGPRGPDPSPHPSDPRVQAPVLLLQMQGPIPSPPPSSQGFRPQPSSLRPKGPFPSPPLSDPGAQAPALCPGSWEKPWVGDSLTYFTLALTLALCRWLCTNPPCHPKGQGLSPVYGTGN
jgi:hypothetical protein